MGGFKFGDYVLLENGDKKVYQISHYSHIWNCYIMKCGKHVAFSLVDRHATPKEVAAGRRL